MLLYLFYINDTSYYLKYCLTYLIVLIANPFYLWCQKFYKTTVYFFSVTTKGI